MAESEPLEGLPKGPLTRPTIRPKNRPEKPGIQASWALIGVAGMLVLAACVGSSTAEGTELTDAQLATMPASQQKILEDRRVTDAEFEGAVLALVSCLEDSGIQVVEFDTRPSGWSIAYGTPGGDTEVDTAVYERCYDESLSYVEQYYLAEREPTEQEKAKERAGMVDCLREAGLDIRDDAEWFEIQDLATVDSQSYVRCLERVRRSVP